MRKILCFFLFILIISCSKDEDDNPATISFVNLKWTKVFGGSGSDVSYAIANTTDGGIVVVGASATADGDVLSNNGDSDLWVVKLDASDNKQWAKSFGGSGNDFASTVVTTTDGG